MDRLKVLDLFSGIGGFSYGLELTGGFKTVAFCECELFPQKILKKHWPNIPIYNDVQTLTAKQLSADGISVDVICGGFPCQDLSVAGKGKGLSGERSGLWWEFYRLIKEIKPSWVIIENVSVPRSRGLDQVLRSLFEIGYDAEWHCIPASAVGAPHQRDRIWIVAYPHSIEQRTWIGSEQSTWHTTRQCSGDSSCMEIVGLVADTSSIRSQGQRQFKQPKCTKQIISKETIELINGCFSELWATEPDVGRVANVVPNRVDRLKCLGNAVVPKIPMLIGMAILDLYGEKIEQ